MYIWEPVSAGQSDEPAFTRCSRCGQPTDERVLCQDCIDADMDWEDHQYNDSRYGL